LIAEDVLRGHHALFFAEAYGQEPLFLYLVAGALVLLGRNVLALRFVTASVGLLTVAAGARLGRRLFGANAALIAAAGLGGMLWPVFWSRVGLRGMTLPLVMCLAAEASWQALTARGRAVTARPRASAVWSHAVRVAALSGVWWGLSAYTYLASRGVPLLLGGFLGYLVLFNRDLLRRRWRELGLMMTVALLIALPLVLYVSGNTDLQSRVYEVDAPLVALRLGDFAPVIENAGKIARMFSVRGDPIERDNYPDRPVFPEPVWAAMFYVGLMVVVLRLRDARYGFVLIWLVVMLSPTLVTVDAPSFVRALGALPAVMLLPGIGGAWLAHQACRLRPWAGRVFAGVVGVAFVANVVLLARDYFVRWPTIPSGQFVWQADLLAVAEAVGACPGILDVTVAGLSNDTMDDTSFDLLLRRDDARVRWVDTGSPLCTGGALVVPQGGGRVLVPSVVTVNDALREWLAAQGAVEKSDARFTEFVVPPLEDVGILADFEGNVQLSALEVPVGPFAPGATLTLRSVWRVGPGEHPPLKIFVHFFDQEGVLRAQHDGLDSPAQFWQPGDVVVQVHTFGVPADAPDGDYRLHVGLYDRETLSPYSLQDGRAFFEGNVVEVRK